MPYSPASLSFSLRGISKIKNNDRHKEYNEKREDVEFLYKTYKWQKLRKFILKRDSYLCVCCREENIIKSAWGVDHIVPAKERPDLFFDQDNLRAICREHNVRLASSRKGEMV